ncbi:phosphoadenosine phosphosulfate reductase family protein [Paenibacillus periandrae]|uniref:phosphoadenosine phosphosulfate reductase family protein n=1 Tax=Paenibacillus periandrae TaxID=1761741 RepID=UPI001F098E98|nr:phosphoadenosine phosphosulfate reductase family protein [Paenibacillus periandrae]
MFNDYIFKDANNKVKQQPNLKFQVDPVRRIWNELKNCGFIYWSSVRDWSSVFQINNNFVVLHHFIGEEPMQGLIESSSQFEWDEIIDKNGVLGPLFNQIVREGMDIYLPNQIFLEALERELSYQPYDYHYQSPKHKLSLWAFGGTKVKVSLHIEIYFNLPMAPYGIRKSTPWPDLTEEGFQPSLFGDLYGEADTLNLKTKKNRRSKKQNTSVAAMDEDLTIYETVNEEKETEVDIAIERLFRENTVLIVAYSGGKDSHYCLDKCVKFKLSHPECKTKLVIVSADTGVENVVFQDHIRKVKTAVGSLPIEIPFLIVKPDINDTYWVCVLGKGYTPPHSNFKYCVTRLKIKPGRKALENFVKDGEKICQILGSRSSESTQRGASMERHYGESFYGQHDVQGIRTATPIRNLSARDVVTYLARSQPAWEGYSNYNLLNLYGSGAGGLAECPIGSAISDENSAIKSCSGKSSRFGCYTCTVVNDDSSLRNMMMDYAELEPLYRVRTLLKGLHDIRYGSVVGIQRKGKYRFEPGFGDLTVQIRVTLLRILRENGIKLQEEEVWEIYKEVCEREIREGLVISQSFRDALFAFLPYRPLFVGHLYDSILDPDGVIDRVTKEDKESIERIWAMMENGELEEIKE